VSSIENKENTNTHHEDNDDNQVSIEGETSEYQHISISEINTVHEMNVAQINT